MKIQVSDLRPNPYRNLSHYPINSDKVDALVRSIKDTDFWDNILVRKAPDGDGFQMAYGHHRYRALLKSHIAEIDVPVRKLDNTTMAKIMLTENMEEWGSNAVIEQESLRAVIEALGRSEIDFPPIKTHAGSFYYDAASDVPYGPFPIAQIMQRAKEADSSRTPALYSLDSLAEFTGWKEYKVKSAHNALSLIQDKIASPASFVGLSPKQALVVTQEGRRILKTTKDASRAKAVVSGLSAGFRKATGAKTGDGDKKRGHTQDVTIHTARRQADRMAGTKLTIHKSKKLPNFEKFIDGIAKACGWFFENKRHQWDQMLQYTEEMPAASKRRLIASLERLVKEATKYIEKLED